MSLDTIRDDTNTYKANKKNLNLSMEEFLKECQNMEESMEVLSGTDANIRNLADEVRKDFEGEQARLDGENRNLEETRKKLVSQLENEQNKLTETQEKVDSISENRYADRDGRISGKCTALWEKCRKMLSELNEPGIDQLIGDLFGTDKDGAASFMDGAAFSETGQYGRFGSFHVARIGGSSDYYVPGDHYAQFLANSSRGSEHVDPEIQPYIAYVNPSAIEGIRLGWAEVQDSAGFWRHHGSPGADTAESFQAVARKIPEVRRLLENGFSLEEVRKNPELRDCVSVYFGEGSPAVEKVGEYYELTSNGRHRILAARAAGCEIPVRVVCTKGWK